ncbi:MAG: transcription elongation factor GreA [Oscillospiraceae bacterium]|nr:transcription elongation factor GreA [Oscillospiraceae bacterium]MBP3520162.1 transcription elongation factor GreA [Oscillospiraceae bacterium]
MHDKLTKKDLQMMKEELDHRRIVLRPKLLEEVKVARAFGDLSENFEYKAAKQEKNKNESRIRYLENMIRTAQVISEGGKNGGVALYDKVTVFLPEEGETEELQIVTTMRKDPLHGLISLESPVGKALLGKQVGDIVHIQVDESYGYDMVIRAVEKGADDGSVPLNTY